MRAVNASRDTVIADFVEHARSLWARSRGLLGRKSLERGRGLLLDPCSGIHTIGMGFPIDALFLTRDGEVVHTVHRMKPFGISRYVFSARSVLELPAGTLQETGTRVGDRVVFEG